MVYWARPTPLLAIAWVFESRSHHNGTFVCRLPSRNARGHDSAQFDESRRYMGMPNPLYDKNLGGFREVNGRHL